MGFPGGAAVKNLPANEGDTRDATSIPGSGRSPGGGNGNPLQYSCLENSTDRGAWQATVSGVAKSQMQLNTQAGVEWAFTHYDVSLGNETIAKENTMRRWRQRTSLMVQCLRIHLPMQGTPVSPLVEEDSTCYRATKPACHNYQACAL